MLFCHIVDDYYLQGWLASAKQKKWWEQNASNPLYKNDYIMALVEHAFSWTFMVHVPIVIAPHGFEDWNEQISLNEYKKILIIELKKGFFTIDQNEISQAMTYVNALYNSTSLPSKPSICAYVIGDKVSNNISRNVKMEETKQIEITKEDLNK